MHYIRVIIVLIVVAVLTIKSSAVVAGQLEDGEDAYERGDYQSAASILLPLADKGDAAAQRLIGMLYYEGQSVTQDYAEAMKWWRKAADQGNDAAQRDVALMYENGEGVPQDYAKAIAWFRLAAVQGNDQAMLNLGFLFENGRGVHADYGEAANWYRKAANSGNATAQFNLGVLYAKGNGVPQSNVLAHMWLNLASAQGIEDAIKIRNVLTARMTRAQLTEAQRLAREWKPEDPKAKMAADAKSSDKGKAPEQTSGTDPALSESQPGGWRVMTDWQDPKIPTKHRYIALTEHFGDALAVRCIDGNVDLTVGLNKRDYPAAKMNETAGVDVDIDDAPTHRERGQVVFMDENITQVAFGDRTMVEALTHARRIKVGVLEDANVMTTLGMDFVQKTYVLPTRHPDALERTLEICTVGSH